MTRPRAQRRARRWAALPLAGGAFLLVVLAGGPALLGDPAAAAKESPPTLTTVVIPDLGPGYAVTSQGALEASQFASDAPDPSAAAGVLATLGKSVWTYERVWQAAGGLNQVQNLLVRFPDQTGAQVFLSSAQHSLESGEIVSSDTVPSIPGARRVTYFAATDQGGVGEAITMRSGLYVDLLSFFSVASGNAQPMSPANAERVARAQYKAMTRAPGGGAPKKGASGGTILTAVLVVAVLALAVATPALLRRRQTAAEAAGTTALAGAPSGGGAVEDPTGQTPAS